MNFLKLLQVFVWNAFETSAVILTNDDIHYHYIYIKASIIQQLGLSVHIFICLQLNPLLGSLLQKSMGGFSDSTKWCFGRSTVMAVFWVIIQMERNKKNFKDAGRKEQKEFRGRVL